MKNKNKYFVIMYGVIALLAIFAFIHYLNTGARNLLFSSIFAFLVFLSTHLSYKYTGSLQSALRNSIFIGIVACAFVYIYVINAIDQKYPVMFVFLYTYIVAVFSFLIFKPPMIDNRLNKLEWPKCITSVMLPGIIIIGLIVFPTIGILGGIIIVTPMLLILLTSVIIHSIWKKHNTQSYRKKKK
ncbi:MAG: hypothetical protein GYA51_12050 [Candidatus Methanofastidiosa archaeon]|jgi:hypothetical protein|nr:hypothetical protein [Candidatus Methanofastidiosa archaeon]